MQEREAYWNYRHAATAALEAGIPKVFSGRLPAATKTKAEDI